jgi:predicted transcriptional regulator of viral defense system
MDDPLTGGGFLQAIDVFKNYMRSNLKKSDVLSEYATRLGNKAVFKRLGYLCELLFPDEMSLIHAAKNNVSSGYSKLDPTGPATGVHVRKWGVIVNCQVNHD